jgi:hypothetical protein
MSGNETQTDDLTLEHRILIQMRQVLASVVRDVTPPPGMRNPLSASTIEDIRGCFSLIAARERELNSGKPNRDLPVYADRAATTRVVDFKPPGNSGSEDD